MENILVLCAHNDDQVLGLGGTIVKYAKEGKSVIVVIFSFGESSHPWLKGEETAQMRVAEAHAADRLLGVDKLIFFGLKEGQFEKEVEKKGIKKKIKDLIDTYQPEKIFTHAIDDPHPDHKAVVKTFTDVYDSNNYEMPVYSYDIWNPLKFKKRNDPKLVVDITQTFKQKIKAFKEHKSQWMTMFTQMPATYARALLNGLDYDCRYAEVFRKLR